MKNILLTLCLLFSLASFGQTVEKSTGILYFSNKASLDAYGAPPASYGAEFCGAGTPRLLYRWDGAAWIPSDSGGDVSNSSGSIDNQIARYDGATGKIIQNSLIEIDDNAELSKVNAMQFNLSASVAHAEGKMHWDADSGTVEIGMPGGNVRVQVGQETVIRVTNSTGGTLTNGQAIYINGSLGNKPTIALANAGGLGTASVTGVLTEDIANNNNGYVTTFGLVRDLNTSAFSAGAVLWLSTTDGVLTDTRPAPPNTATIVGVVVVSHATTGIILVSIARVPRIVGLSDVAIASPNDGDVISFDNSSQTWIAIQPTSGVISQISDTITQTAHGFSLLQPISTLSNAYIGADTTNFTIGVVNEVVDVNNFIITYAGKVTATAHGKTIDSVYYTPNPVGQAVLGSSVTSISQPVYKVIDANTIHVQIFRPASLAILSKLTPEEVETFYNQQVSTVTQVEAEAGISTTIRTWTSERVKQAIVALGGGGVGDMTKAVYDPTNVNGDAFDMDNMIEGTAKILTIAERAAIIANTAKTSNATHTGEVTGATALTLDATTISNKTLVTADNADHVLIEDATDGLLKKVLVSDFGGGGSGDVVGSAFSIDNAVAIYDGATGKIIQNSLVTISDLGALTTTDEINIGFRNSYQTGLNNASIYTSQSGGIGQEFSATGALIFQSRNTGNYGFYWVSQLAATTKMHLTATGELGINQLTPTEKLDVVGNIKVSGTIETTGGILDELLISGTASPSLKLEDLRGSAVDGDEQGQINFRQFDSGLDLARIQSRSHRDGVGTVMQGTVGEGGEIVFSTGKVAVASAGTVMSEKMIITKDGDVGIGLLVPTEKLDVVGNIKSSGTIETGGATATIGTLVLKANQIIGATEDNYVITYDDGTGQASLEPLPSRSCAEMYITSASPQVLAITTGVYSKIVGHSTDVAFLQGFTYATGTFTKTASGTQEYYVTASVSGSFGTGNTVIEANVFVNGAIIDKIAYSRKIGTGGDVGSAALSGLLSLTLNDTIDVRLKADNTDNWTTENLNFSVIQAN